jgi:molybdate transport system ATP-binding protein
VAALVGLNLLRGQARDGVVSWPGGQAIVAADRLSGPAFVSFSPTAVSLFTEPPAGSPRNVWPGTVRSLAPHGDAVRVQVDTHAPLLADITPAALAALRLGPGSSVWASVKATEVSIYPM